MPPRAFPPRTPVLRTKSEPVAESAAESRFHAKMDARIADQIELVDALFASAGLIPAKGVKSAAARKPSKRKARSAEELRPPAAEPIRAVNGVEWVAAPALKQLEWLWHGFSTRRNGVSRVYKGTEGTGDLNLGFTAEDLREHALQNRALFVEAITGSVKAKLVTIRQVHSNVVALADASQVGKPCEGDGLITDTPGLLIGILTADCTPVLVADRKNKVVAAFHAGWRGTAKRIVEHGVGRMLDEFGSRPEDLVAAIGPSIGPCCYVVGEEVIAEFTSQFAYASKLFHEIYKLDPAGQENHALSKRRRVPGDSLAAANLHLDVAGANRQQLIDAGVKARNISMVGGCTRCQPELFFSHRGSNGRTGRMLSVIGIRG